MRNTGLEEAEAGIKIAGRNINNLRYADDTTLMAKSEEELKSLLKSEVAQSCLTLCNPMDCSLEIKRRLVLGRKVMTNLDSLLKTVMIIRLKYLRTIKKVQRKSLLNTRY